MTLNGNLVYRLKTSFSVSREFSDAVPVSNQDEPRNLRVTLRSR